MNSITLHQLSKKFNRNWIFKNVSLTVKSGDIVAVCGYNGSGKSTLIKMITGFVTPTSGKVEFVVDDENVDAENWFRYIAYAAPYIDFIDDFTLIENISFYNKFKPLHENLSVDEVVEIAFLDGAEDKQFRNFSSGMKQRLKLTLALLSDIPFLFLDEPLSNLDERGRNWYYGMIEKFKREKIIVICTNNPSDEAPFATSKLNIEDYKK